MALWPSLRGPWRLAFGLLVLKALGQIGVGIAPEAGWAAMPAYRILYLHLMLLGFVSLGLVAAARGVWGEAATRGRAFFAAAVGLVLFSLLTLTPAWPAAWGGAWVTGFVAGCALGPVLAAAWMAVAPPTPPSSTPS